MQLTDFVQSKNFTNALPQGDTIIEVKGTQAKDATRQGKEGPYTVCELTLENGRTIDIPLGVMGKIKALIAQGAQRIRITRDGTGFGSKYAVVAI